MTIRKRILHNEKGQSILEYVLTLFVVVMAIIVIVSQLKKKQFFFKTVVSPLVKHITYNYKYADPSAQGWDEGTPKKHIQISKPNEGNTFRLFQPTRRGP